MSEASSIWKAWRIFCNGSLLYWAIPVAVLLFMLRRKNKYRVAAGVALLLMFIFLYNPVSYSYLAKITGSSAYRIFWLLPGWAAFAYIIFCIIRLIPWQWLQLLLTVLICAGGMFYAIRDNGYTNQLSNIYQIPEETMILAEDMMEIMDERGMDQAVLYGNYDFLATLRQYSSRFILHTAPRNHAIMERYARSNNYLGLGHQITTGQITMDEDFASEILIDNEVYFIVLYRTLTNSVDYLGSMGWYEVAGTDTFVVLTQDRFAEDADE